MAYQLLTLALLQVASVSAEGLVKGVVNHGSLNLIRRQAGNQAGCNSLEDVYSSCAAATPSFTDEPDSQAASCLCYSGSTWQPSVIDGYILECASYIQTALPSSYSAYAQLEDFCTDIGNVRAASSAPSAASASASALPTTSQLVSQSSAVITTAPTTTSLQDAPGCSQWFNSYLSCSSATPGFDNLNDGQAASCLCYVGTSWAPSILDNEATTCAEFVKTADPSLYPSWTAVAGLCTDVGDVRAESTPTAAATTSSTPVFHTSATKSTPSTTSTTSTTSKSTTSAAVQVTVTASTSKAWAAGGSVASLHEGWMRAGYLSFVLVTVGMVAIL